MSLSLFQSVSVCFNAVIFSRHLFVGCSNKLWVRKKKCPLLNKLGYIFLKGNKITLGYYPRDENI